MKTIKISKEHIISSDEEFVTIKVQHNEISDLYHEIDELEGEVGDLSDEIYNLEKKISKLEDKIFDLEDTLDNLSLKPKNLHEKTIIELFEKVFKKINYIQIENALENLLASYEKN